MMMESLKRLRKPSRILIMINSMLELALVERMMMKLLLKRFTKLEIKLRNPKSLPTKQL